MNQKSDFRHPGREFIRINGLPGSLSNIQAYVQDYTEYLRAETDQLEAPPVSVDSIYQHFGIYTALKEIEQDGLAMFDQGAVLVKRNSSIARQRFTKAHELVEFLFDELISGSGSYGKELTIKKERLCNIGASRLLMPREWVGAMVDLDIPRFEMIGQVRRSFNVSVTAASFAAIEFLPTMSTVVEWRLMHSSLEEWVIQSQSHNKGVIQGASFMKKLRVKWAFTHPKSSYRFFSNYDSASDQSILYQVYHEGLKVDRHIECLPRKSSLSHCMSAERYRPHNGSKFVLGLHEIPRR